jgi:type II secretory pathway component PulC
MPTTPDTLNDMILGYAVGLAIFFIMVASIWWRYRSLAADEQTLEKLKNDIQQEGQTARKAEVTASD